MPLATIEEILKELKDGKMIILVDDEDRENEGDLTMAAEKATPEAINFMATYGSWPHLLTHGLRAARKIKASSNGN